MQEKSIKTPLTKPPKNHRAGHRARLRERFRKAGPDSVQDHELLELILFRAIPRRDVKDLAHKLIERFGDLSAVLAAPLPASDASSHPPEWYCGAASPL